ncbi:hypothetical protein DFJ74DRAFT_477214 [Hyaloraphidium curvatum]|nr:hypothetical protein DFJ74DRAFT_477214 [Hyaloraphidium curvatum]
MADGVGDAWAGGFSIPAADNIRPGSPRTQTPSRNPSPVPNPPHPAERSRSPSSRRRSRAARPRGASSSPSPARVPRPRRQSRHSADIAESSAYPSRSDDRSFRMAVSQCHTCRRASGSFAEPARPRSALLGADRPDCVPQKAEKALQAEDAVVDGVVPDEGDGRLPMPESVSTAGNQRGRGRLKGSPWLLGAVRDEVEQVDRSRVADGPDFRALQLPGAGPPTSRAPYRRSAASLSAAVKSLPASRKARKRRFRAAGSMVASSTPKWQLHAVEVLEIRAVGGIPLRREGRQTGSFFTGENLKPPAGPAPNCHARRALPGFLVPDGRAGSSSGINAGSGHA